MLFLTLVDDEDTRNYLEKLYNNYKYLCYKIARSIVNTRNDSEDVVQQTFMKVAEFLQDHGKDSIKEEKAFVSKIAKNTAIVAIIIVFTVISFNADAIRVEVLNFFIEETKTNVHIEAGRRIPGDTLLDEYNNLYVLNYIPEGYILEDVVNFNSMFRMSYVYQDKKISFSQEQGEIDIQIDNERSVISEYTLTTGETAILSKGDGYSMIIWENNLRTFIINGDVDTDTIIRIAENITWKE